MYDFLGYATTLLNNIVHGLNDNLSAVRVIIVSYPECTIGVVRPNSIKTVRYPKRRCERYMNQFFNLWTGFSEDMSFTFKESSTETEERNSCFYTTSNVMEHDFYFIDSHTLGTKYSRSP